MELPSNKVGIALVIVVLVVVGTIVGSRIKVEKNPFVDLENVEVVVARTTQDNFKAGDGDSDGLSDWLEEFYRTDPKNPDTDGDGTKDGEEISLDRDPTIPGPKDPLITREDLIKKEADFSSFATGTVTDKMSIKLFSDYITLKKQGVLSAEDESKLVDNISQEVLKQASLKDIYLPTSIYTVNSTSDTVEVYGDRLAQVSLSNLYRMDNIVKFNESTYLGQIGKEYKAYAEELKGISVPTIMAEAHLQLMNYLYKTGVFYESLSKADEDPLTSVVIMNQYKELPVDDVALYTAIAQSFKNNGIIFDTESTINFWQKFQN